MKVYSILIATFLALLLLAPASVARPSPVSASPEVEPHINYWSPADSGVSVDLRAGVNASVVVVDTNTGVTAGSWAQCGFTGCDLVRGVAAFSMADAYVAGADVDAFVVGNVIHFGGSPTNVWSGFGAGCSVTLPSGATYFCYP